MVPEDRQLLADLARINRQVPEFVLRFIDGKVTPEEQLAFARKLSDAAAAVARHANERRRIVLDAQLDLPPNVELELRPPQAS